MSSIIERLTEGVVNRDMRAEGHALLSKWERTGLLEGLTKNRSREAMARLLENQAKELLRENSTMAAGDVEGFAAVAFPIVRRVFAGLIANDLVSVQPMSLPSGLIFFLDFVFSPNLGESGTMTDRLGNIQNASIYGTNRVGSQITGGVSLLDTASADLSGPRTVGARGYAYASATGSVSVQTASVAIKAQFNLGGADDNLTGSGRQKMLLWDPDLINLSGSGYKVLVLDVNKSVFDTARADFDNLGAFEIAQDSRDDILSGSGYSNTTEFGTAMTGSGFIRRLTRVVTATDSGTGNEAVRFTFTLLSSSVLLQPIVLRTAAVAMPLGGYPMSMSVPYIDNIAAGSSVGSVVGGANWPLENTQFIPEIDIKVDSIAVTAMTKKLKAKWTPELGQDLNAYHNLDAEVELTSILSEQIALEIDREILGDLVGGATASTYYWSRSPGLFVDRESVCKGS